MGEFPSSHMPPQLLTQPFTLSLSPPQSIPYDFIHSHLSHTPFLQSTILFFSCCKPSAFSLLSASLFMLLPHSSPPLLLPSISCFLSIPPLISASLSPGSSCHGVVLLAERGRRRHTDGSTDGQQAVRGS